MKFTDSSNIKGFISQTDFEKVLQYVRINISRFILSSLDGVLANAFCFFQCIILLLYSLVIILSLSFTKLFNFGS
jgi:hypothetical protein